MTGVQTCALPIWVRVIHVSEGMIVVWVVTAIMLFIVVFVVMVVPVPGAMLALEEIL